LQKIILTDIEFLASICSHLIEICQSSTSSYG